ncbi:hypothetical protein COHA_004095 [Chlorella ohadii]|uniref:Laminin EGF-like domain-containing protein n=1 Tax=Chlorella ohadii TaxID=2649997 RepID=A0AAD5DSQ3_9CHLO|nr:hypothetical protein COHA_004095 [Chlorella ohadii]
MGNRCQGCSVCQAGFSLSDSQCAACTGGQALDVCTTYGGDNSCECTSCANGYRLEEGACVECKMLNPNCKDFKANSCDCATCEAGYSGDNCELCAVPDSCMTALDDACQGCAVCHSGFAVADKQFTACTGGQAPEACAAYADAGTSCECATCPDGWQLAQGACTECAADPTCTAFKANSCDCDTCASGHYLTVDNKCGKCPDPPRCATAAANVCDGCDVCEAGNSLDEATRQCTLCTDGQAPDVCAAYAADNTCDCARCINSWQLDGATCVPCQDVPNCQTYGDSSCDCAQCNPGYTGDSCEACASGYKRNGDACEVCDGQGCDTFADGSCTCAVCLTGYALDAESGACRQCPENQACEAYEPNSCNCVTCTSGSAHATVQCQLDNCEAPLEGCSGCSQCASGYTLPAGSSKCEQCQTPATNCEKFKPNSCSECVTCASGYTLDEAASACNKPNTCVCAKCKQDGFAAPSCNTCDDGWQPKDENICERCTAIEHCKSYDSTCACATCDAGYSGPACRPEAAGQCATKPPGCAEAEAGNCERCAVCANTHQLDWYAGTCSQCPENPRCETLYQSTCGCAKCRDGYVGWMCEACASGWKPDVRGGCEHNHRRDDESGTCGQCVDNPRCLATYWNSCNCYQCAEGYAGENCDNCANGWRRTDSGCERCPEVPNCQGYDESCACTSCAPGFSGPDCKPVSPRL